jgi:hypothetical protein
MEKKSRVRICYPAYMPNLFHPWPICIHEAGHAVAGLATGRTIATARVADKAGRVEFEPTEPTEASALDLARRRLVVHVAGVVAEDQGGGRELVSAGLRRLGYQHFRPGSDCRQAWDRALAILDYSEDTFGPTAALALHVIEQAEASARVLLRGRWGDLVAIAEALGRRPYDLMAGWEIAVLLKRQRRHQAGVRAATGLHLSTPVYTR